MCTMVTILNVVQIIIFDIAHTVYIRFTVFSNFSKFQLYLANFGYYEISSPVMPTTLSMANIVYIIISNIAQIVCITFKAF